MPKAKAATGKKSSAKPKVASAKKSSVVKKSIQAAPVKSATKAAAGKLSAKAAPAKQVAPKKGTSQIAAPVAKTANKVAGKVSGKDIGNVSAKSAVKGLAATVAAVAAAAVVVKVAKAVGKSAPKFSADSGSKAGSKVGQNSEKKSDQKHDVKSVNQKPNLKKAASAVAPKAHMMPAAPSSRMTLLKLGYSTKEQAAILAAPHGFKIPSNADEPATLDAQYDFILIFVENITEAEVICASLNPSLRPKGRAWVAWPKGGVSDVNLDQLAGMVEAEGLQKVAHLSLDERWSAAKFMHPKAER